MSRQTPLRGTPRSAGVTPSNVAPSPIQAYDFSHDMSTASRVVGGHASRSTHVPDEFAPSKPLQSIIPLNLGLLPNLTPDPNDPFDGTAHHSGLSVDLNHDRLVQLQLDTADYVGSLDHILRNLHEHKNSRLVRRLKEASGVPLSFLYFRTQQEMLKLTGDLTTQRERETLNTLTSLLEH